MSLTKINDKARNTTSNIATNAANGKTRVQAIVPSQLKRPRLKRQARSVTVIPFYRIMATTSKITIIPLLAMMMSACQSSQSLSTMESKSAQSMQNTAPLLQQKAQDIQAPALAKTALIKALNQQRRRSYAYHTDALASNETYRSELATATPQQLAMSDNVNTHCSHMHDEAYVDMLEHAEAADKDIADDDFAVQRQALKAAYLECQTLYDDWEMAQYNEYSGFNLEDYLNLEDELLTSDDAADEGQAAEDDAMLAAILAESSTNEAIKADNSQAEFLPGYDSSHTRVDKRRATLLNDYLLEPLTLTSQGVYRPLSGQLSIMPTIQYKIRNHQALGQHYIYVNAKEGAIYVWADTLAMTLSYYLDDKLGTQMHNKWIKLDLNDGSLPDRFGRDFIESHFLAIDNVRAHSAVNEYGFVSTATLLNTGSKPHSSHAPYLAGTPTVIERRLDQQSIAKDLQQYRQTLYQQLTDKYPMLIEDDAIANSEVADIDDMAIANEIVEEDDFEAIDEIMTDVEVLNTDTDNNNKAGSDVSSNADIANDTPKSPPINSLLVIKKLLTLIKVDNETDDGLNTLATNDSVIVTDSEMSAATTAALKEAKASPIAPKHPSIEYASYDTYSRDDNVDKASMSSPWYLRDVYGLDNRQNIQWHLRQYQNPASDRASSATNDTLGRLTFEALTRYSAVSPLTPMFEGLPQGAAMPNADNTINFSDYSQDLMQRYENGEGLERGKMIMENIKKIGGGLIR